MSGRTFAIGDIHGALRHFEHLWEQLPEMDEHDTVVFLGDYVDRGLNSRGVLDTLRALPDRTPAGVVFLCGNHEQAWLRVVDQGWPEFVLPKQNGAWAFARSYLGVDDTGPEPTGAELEILLRGTFIPPDVVAWLRELGAWYEDDHAIYLHAGLPRVDGRFLHPSEVSDATVLMWLRSKEFYMEYHGKRVVCGHTSTSTLPEGASSYTPEDPHDLWFRGDVVAIDTRCGKPGGFLTCLELPSLTVYESR